MRQPEPRSVAPKGRRAEPNGLDASVLAVVDEWRAETRELRQEIREGVTAVKSLAADASKIVHAITDGGKFVRRWVPWIIAVIGILTGISPTAIKAALAAIGHPAP